MSTKPNYFLSRRIHWIAPYAVTIFVSATLLFLIQPIIAKQLLPRFGGAAAVWTACMVFFQCLLLVGYLYAHSSIRFMSYRLQSVVHALLLAASIVAVFLPVSQHWRSTTVTNPAYDTFKVLLQSIGLPYFLLSSTSPLLQAWYSRVADSHLPYRLFALSNLGSFLALVAYPFAIEPFLDVDVQLAIWRMAYAVFALLCLVITILASGHRAAPAISDGRYGVGNENWHGNWRRNLTWGALAACSSALLLAVTNNLCQNIAPVPLLWIVPLAIYLVSFALCFDHDGLYKPAVYRLLVPTALIAIVWADVIGVRIAVLIYLVSLFIICMFCHGQLSAMKPGAQHLTAFYLWVSAGGAFGGLFVGLLAPAVFVDFLELQIALSACLVLALWLLFGYRSKPFLAICAVATVVLLRVFGSLSSETTMVYKARNFYGALAIGERLNPGAAGKVRTLLHGRVVHGGQVLTDGDRREPKFYYGRESGVGVALRRPLPAHRVGAVGLGAGTVAAYGKVGDYYRFYEINPLVADLARSQFTYLRDSMARTDVVLGDARLSLEREADEHFDTLVLDAFSGDSIPVHLLTREAFQCYFRHLAQNGILAVHVSNNYLDLRPVVGEIAATFGKRALAIESGDQSDKYISLSEWILVTSDASFLDLVHRNTHSQFLRSTGRRLWTDQYSNVVSALR
jgi:hypothetical protein